MNANYLMIFMLCSLLLSYVIIYYTIIKKQEWDTLLTAVVCLFVVYGGEVMVNMAVKTEIHVIKPRKTVSVKASDNTGIDFKKAGYIKIFNSYYIVQDNNVVFPDEKNMGRRLLLKKENMREIVFEITDPVK